MGFFKIDFLIWHTPHQEIPREPKNGRKRTFSTNFAPAIFPRIPDRMRLVFPSRIPDLTHTVAKIWLPASPRSKRSGRDWCLKGRGLQLVRSASCVKQGHCIEGGVTGFPVQFGQRGENPKTNYLDRQIQINSTVTDFTVGTLLSRIFAWLKSPVALCVFSRRIHPNTRLRCISVNPTLRWAMHHMLPTVRTRANSQGCVGVFVGVYM